MELTHYQSLIGAYGLALLLWRLAHHFLPHLWAETYEPQFKTPWKELVGVILATVAVLVIGVVYTKYGLIPKIKQVPYIIGVLNQGLIFSPALLWLLWRKDAFKSAWLPNQFIAQRIFIGLAIALITIGMFLVLRKGSNGYGQVLAETYQLKNLPYLAQVLGEDFVIALFFVRFQALIGKRLAIIIVAALFAAGHIPAFLANGVTWAEMQSLIFDALLSIGIISVLQRSSDIWWFWMVHFAMDMMQFYSTSAKV